MSKYTYCPVGGMEGILVSLSEVKQFQLAIGADFSDEVIPLPNLTPEQQKAMLTVCENHDEDIQYWEKTNGKHGCCCTNCGTVTEEYIPPYMRKSTPPQPSERKFFVNGVIVSAMTRPYDDAFFEIVTGKYKGNLVHTFDLVK